MYEFIRSARWPVSREEAAATVGISRKLADHVVLPLFQVRPRNLTGQLSETTGRAHVLPVLIRRTMGGPTVLSWPTTAMPWR